MSDIIEEKIEGIKNVKMVKDDNGKLWVRQVSNINIQAIDFESNYSEKLSEIKLGVEWQDDIYLSIKGIYLNSYQLQ